MESPKDIHNTHEQLSKDGMTGNLWAWYLYVGITLLDIKFVTCS